MDRRALGWAAALVVMTCGVARATEPLAIRVYDAYGVPPSEMARAREVATALLANGDVEARWIDCTIRESCMESVGSREIVVRLVFSRPNTVPGVLGEALVTRTDHAGVFATVFGDHVDMVAARVQADPGVLLGRTLAHEIGHLLGQPHASSGLMRSRWSERDLRDPATTTATTCRAGTKCVRG